MDDLNERLSEILGDPESMKRITQMAENLMADGKETEPPTESPDGLDAETLGKITGALSCLKSAKDDSRTSLLIALKPHLSKQRQKKADSAVKLLKLLEILPRLKDSGLFDI